jgi:hypothetical protein
LLHTSINTATATMPAASSSAQQQESEISRRLQQINRKKQQQQQQPVQQHASKLSAEALAQLRDYGSRVKLKLAQYQQRNSQLAKANTLHVTKDRKLCRKVIHMRNRIKHLENMLSFQRKKIVEYEEKIDASNIAAEDALNASTTSSLNLSIMSDVSISEFVIPRTPTQQLLRGADLDDDDDQEEDVSVSDITISDYISEAGSDEESDTAQEEEKQAAATPTPTTTGSIAAALAAAADAQQEQFVFPPAYRNVAQFARADLESAALRAASEHSALNTHKAQHAEAVCDAQAQVEHVLEAHLDDVGALRRRLREQLAQHQEQQQQLEAARLASSAAASSLSPPSPALSTEAQQQQQLQLLQLREENKALQHANAELQSLAEQTEAELEEEIDFNAELQQQLTHSRTQAIELRDYIGELRAFLEEDNAIAASIPEEKDEEEEEEGDEESEQDDDDDEEA